MMPLTSIGPVKQERLSFAKELATNSFLSTVLQTVDAAKLTNTNCVNHNALRVGDN